MNIERIDARCDVGCAISTQSTILVDGLYLPGVGSGIAIETGLGSEACHLAVLGDDIADGIWNRLP